MPQNRGKAAIRRAPTVQIYLPPPASLQFSGFSHHLHNSSVFMRRGAAPSLNRKPFSHFNAAVRDEILYRRLVSCHARLPSAKMATGNHPCRRRFLAGPPPFAFDLDLRQ